jgi:hypothetical protein
MPRKGGGIGADAVNAGLWGVAAANSDGSVMGTIGNRLWYGFLILGVPLLLIATVYLFFGHTTKKEPFDNKNKDVRKRPMFRK